MYKRHCKIKYITGIDSIPVMYFILQWRLQFSSNEKIFPNKIILFGQK